MRTYYEGPTYTVSFDESDTNCFTRYTGASPEVVRGRGAFVFDSQTGDVLGRKGAARGREDAEWLAFSQDAQEHARDELGRHGVVVNPYDFGCELPEIRNPKKNKQIGKLIVMDRPAAGHSTVRPGEVGTIANVDEDNVIYVEWEGGESSALAKGDKYTVHKAENPPARISRTRGVKTMRGPYSAKKGYKPWIQRRGKLGEGFLTNMTKKEREKSLDRCVRAYGYRSCLGSIMVLERAKKGPRGKGKGVGVKYASKLKSARSYLKEKYGGPGSFKREEERREVRRAAEAGPGYRVNPSAEEHARRAHAYLHEGQDAMRRAMEHHRRAKEGNLVRATVGGEIDQACAFARDAHRYAILARHEIDDSSIGEKDANQFREAATQLDKAADALLDDLSCAWAS